MRRGEGARVPEANGRNRRGRQRIASRPPRPRKLEPQSDDEVAEAQGDPLLGVTGPRDVECAPVALPGSGEGGQRRLVAATTGERKGRHRSGGQRRDPCRRGHVTFSPAAPYSFRRVPALAPFTNTGPANVPRAGR